MAVRFVVSIILVCQIIAIVSCLQIGDGCTYGQNTPGVCKLIYRCRQVLLDLRARKPFFNCKPGSNPVTVCCPDLNAPTTPPPPSLRIMSRGTQGRLSELKCQEYSEYVYKNLTRPVLIPGGQPIIERQSQCPFNVLPLIVGGVKASSMEFPHMARIGYGPKNNVEYSCGGTVISRRYILTAGHCAVTRDNSPTVVRIGDLIFDDNEDEDVTSPVTIRVARVITHPNYSPKLQYHDIALLRLAENIIFNNFVRPACLNTDTRFNQPKAIATGWGHVEWFGESSKHLLKTGLDIFTFSECNAKYADNRKTPQGLQENQHLCAGSRSDTNDTCEGDSGGPLQVYHEIHCMYRVIGVTSFGKACGTRGIPTVYTKVSNYIDWIESIAFSYG